MHNRTDLSYGLSLRETRLHGRSQQAIPPLYGHPRWIGDLDIVNELAGHTGCVNALSWSTSGQLLASGSDDKYLNIHKFQPDGSLSQFSLATAIATGHQANIFSVKFMPHSGDRILVSCAGDSQVRIFDLEYSANTSANTARGDAHVARAAAARRRSRRINFDDTTFMSEANTNCKVFRSHSDRVKRIVTESSPHLFLSCSEDGEVRQWDLRQPSSAYPGGRHFDGDEDLIPPPLISYKRYGLDLNTISCSASQPYYIALGGANKHCFLHDRRMLGRDQSAEAGLPSQSVATSSSGSAGANAATRCVKKFAPQQRTDGRQTRDGHITACKISDAYPNELLVSWSGDQIYTFDIHRSPDVSDNKATQRYPAGKAGGSRSKDIDRKRKRSGASNTSASQGRLRRSAPATPQRNEARREDQDEIALRVQYGNGQSQDIALSSRLYPAEASSAQLRGPLSSTSRTADDLARKIIRLRSILFERRARTTADVTEITDHTTRSTAALNMCASLLPGMKEIHQSWQYPAGDEVQVMVHRQLRSHRDSCIRFVQAAGVLSRCLGGTLQVDTSNEHMVESFDRVQVLRTEGPDITIGEQFCYDFVKAILLWLGSGVGAVLDGFSSASIRDAARFPVPVDADSFAIEENLAPYLLSIAGTDPIMDIDANQFEVDENRVLFESGTIAVQTFIAAMRIPFADLSSGSELEAQSRETARDFWGHSVARGLLHKVFASRGFSTISRAFGGSAPAGNALSSDEDDVPTNREESHARPVPDDSDDDMDVIDAEYGASDTSEMLGDEPEDSDDANDYDDDNEDDDDDDTDNDVEEDSDADITSEEDEGFPLPRRVYRSSVDRRRLQSTIEPNVECVPHTRVYKGHCNVRTVKDVNYYGLHDEYIVSGSDDGHLFIWDRKTTKLVNILEGDGEVVNVIQGHPYEPMLAVSGIDDTIKIFSPDSKARTAARLGQGVEAADSSVFSSISWPQRVRARRVSQNAPAAGPSSEPAVGQQSAARPHDDEDDEFVAPTGLKSRKRLHQEYQITSENDSKRRSGNEDAFMTRAMLAQLAARIREARAGGVPAVAGGGREVIDAEGRRLVLSDDCHVM